MCRLVCSEDVGSEGTEAQMVGEGCTGPDLLVLIEPPSDVRQEVPEDLPVAVVVQAAVPLLVVAPLSLQEVIALFSLPKIKSCTGLAILGKGETLHHQPAVHTNDLSRLCTRVRCVWGHPVACCVKKAEEGTHAADIYKAGGSHQA